MLDPNKRAAALAMLGAFLFSAFASAVFTRCTPETTASAPAEKAEQRRKIEIRATEFGFTPNRITVSPGEALTFVVVNAGFLEHDLAIEIDGNKETTLTSARLAPGASGSFDFTAPMRAGGYTFRCPHERHHALGMMGMLNVSSGDAPSEASAPAAPFASL